MVGANRSFCLEMDCSAAHRGKLTCPVFVQGFNDMQLNHVNNKCEKSYYVESEDISECQISNGSSLNA